MNAPANITRFLFEVPGTPDQLRVVGFEAGHGLSSLYRCELELASENPALDLQALIGKPGILTLFDAREPQYLHGEIVAARQEASGKRFTFYRVAIVPKLAFLGYRTNLRIFQDKSAPDIVKQVLDEAGISGKDVRFELTDSYPRRTYCTQYRETDLHFIQRLLAEEGIYYFFEHSHEHHTLVIADSKSSFKPIAGSAKVRYKQRSGMVASEESIYSFSARHSVRTGTVSLRDYHFEKSRLLLEKESQREPITALADYLYPGNFTDPAEGKRQADLRLQAHQANAHTVQGQSDCARLAVGRTFTLQGHPRSDLNTDYTLTSLQLRGRQPQSLEENASAEGTRFDVEFSAIPAKTDYRPPRLDEKPCIEGSQTAFVTGPKGEDIYTDQYGRVKVQFHWDREAKHDENASCWVRVSQGWAGNQWGSMVIPRVGMEVIVSFLNGDPDRPLVTGVVYNGTSPPPYPLPTHKTRSTFKSLSTPGGGGYNELRIEDKKGSEEIYLHGEKDLELYVKNDLKEWVGNEHHLTVQNHQHIDVRKDQHLTVAQGLQRKTGKSQSQSIGKDYQLKISGTATGQAGQIISVKAGMTLVIEAGTELSLKAGGSIVKLDPGGVTIKGPLVRINTGGAAMPARPAVPVAPKPAAAADKGEGPGQVSAQALVNGRKAAAVPAKATASTLTPAGTQAFKAKDTDKAASDIAANSTLTVKVSRSDNQQAFANAAVKINGPSGTKEIKTNAQGEATFTGLLPGTYSAVAQLSESDAKKYGNPKTCQAQVKNNGQGELPLQVGMRKVSIDVQVLGTNFSAHNNIFNGMKALLVADGKTCEGVFEAGRLQFEVPASAQRFELTFADKQGLTYLNSPKS
jgi:type VI secretion system secreted protein VgrG